MDSTNRWTSEREAHKAQANREELVERIMRALPEDGAAEPLEGLLLSRASSPTGLGHSVFFPAFCVIAQGRKEILLGDNRYWYDPAHYLIATAELPIASQITEASKERPYLSLILTLDPSLVGSVMIEAGHEAPQSHSLVTAIDVSPLDAGLLDAVVRLVKLLDSPSEVRFLAPLVSIEEVARELGMSVSGFHHHFKTLTAMSPLQFQKQLRLQEARRLMLGEGLDAASAGYRVGYDDASYFNREYKKLFGAPPVRDVERLREGASESVGQGTV